MTWAEAGRRGYLKSKDAMCKKREDDHQNAIRKWLGKECLGCKKPLRFEQRRNDFCSHSCAGFKSNAARSLLVIRNCLECGTVLTKSDGWRARFCSRLCAKDFKYKAYINRWLDGKENGGNGICVTNAVRRWLKEKFGDKCSRCGWSERNPVTGSVPVQIDHIDGNPRYHHHKNIRQLCPNCHSLTETFGALNTARNKRKRHAGVV